VQYLMHHSPLLQRFERGELTTAQFYDEVRRKTGFTGTLAEFSEFFADVFTPSADMVQLQAQLQVQGFPTYIFSNTNELAVHHIRQSFPFFARFNGYVLSYEHGAMKPEPRLYEVMETMTGQTGPAILYLDDILENVESGQQRGWQTIHHQSPDKTRRTLQEMGLGLNSMPPSHECFER
jgi:2-haloacid dehalogenase